MELGPCIKKFSEPDWTNEIYVDDGCNLQEYLNKPIDDDEEKLKKICELKENHTIENHLKEKGYDCDLNLFNEDYEKTFINPWGNEIYSVFDCLIDYGIESSTKEAPKPGEDQKSAPAIFLTDSDFEDDTNEAPKPGCGQKPTTAMESIRAIWRDELRKKLKEKHHDISGPKILQIANKLQATIYDVEIKKAQSGEEIIVKYDEALDNALKISDEMIKQ